MRTLGDDGAQSATAIAALSDELFVIVGDNAGTIDTGEQAITAMSGTDGFVAIINTTGAILTLLPIESSNDLYITGVAIDVVERRIFITGRFSGDVEILGEAFSGVAKSDVLVVALDLPTQ